MITLPKQKLTQHADYVIAKETPNGIRTHVPTLGATPIFAGFDPASSHVVRYH